MEPVLRFYHRWGQDTAQFVPPSPPFLPLSYFLCPLSSVVKAAEVLRHVWKNEIFRKKKSPLHFRGCSHQKETTLSSVMLTFLTTAYDVVYSTHMFVLSRKVGHVLTAPIGRQRVLRLQYFPFSSPAGAGLSLATCMLICPS